MHRSRHLGSQSDHEPGSEERFHLISESPTCGCDDVIANYQILGDFQSTNDSVMCRSAKDSQGSGRSTEAKGKHSRTYHESILHLKGSRSKLQASKYRYLHITYIYIYRNWTMNFFANLLAAYPGYGVANKLHTIMRSFFHPSLGSCQKHVIQKNACKAASTVHAAHALRAGKKHM